MTAESPEFLPESSMLRALSLGPQLLSKPSTSPLERHAEKHQKNLKISQKTQKTGIEFSYGSRGAG
jgi:hypothetical protein